ncbi:hypothetical protein CG007_02570 [Mesoplasma entomophilum]|uniref:Uncharacterized protein n=1 Tax=Mesoplasma entomophilum TaxID=2149 RepID=A0A3S5XZT4_9MOLU|nr:hypothetical protein [Mesoplasma entomophilum]ATQ35655.1 hypothetical protein CS528_02685 [Mesoplasma entomophilum]ATZ19624.1 hypothetical protein MENTO_v1c05200 [Mesoplasma entomophilum]AVN60485.1 hypothetical protein CG007_02570 [Mesoplasma entomophilum]
MKSNKKWFKDQFKGKLLFWRADKDDILNENELDNFFKSLFVNAGSEKEIVLDLIKKRGIKSFLFYTDVRNIGYILKNGIQPTQEIVLNKDENYHVWGYHQKQDSSNLDFDISSRAHFWKWSRDAAIDTSKFCVIGIDPEKLAKTTTKDWIFDRSFGMINIIETIHFDTIKWILIRDEQYYNYANNIIKELGLEIKLYLSHDGLVKVGE